MTGKSSTGGYFVCDHWGHQLKWPIPKQQLVEFFQTYASNTMDNNSGDESSNSSQSDKLTKKKVL